MVLAPPPPAFYSQVQQDQLNRNYGATKFSGKNIPLFSFFLRVSVVILRAYTQLVMQLSSNWKNVNKRFC
jgi:hypothetical protein